jgi:holo-[acyl-carrier protein] synthase
VIALGTDLVRISRLASHRSSAGDAFVRRVFTQRETQLCGEDAACLAGRWAVKEAVMKALGAGIGEIPMTDIEVDRHESGRPVLAVTGRAAQLARDHGITSWAVSISHDGDYATATVIGSAG